MLIYYNKIYKRLGFEDKEKGNLLFDYLWFIEYFQPRAFLIENVPGLEELDEADYVVNLAKLKTHSLMGLTLGIKNVFGLVKPEFRGQMHFQTGKDRDEFAHMLIDVYNLVNPDLTIIDGIIGMEGNGPANGVARKFGFVGASTHAYALDIEVAKILNTDENKIPLLKIGKKRFNIVSEPIGDEIKIDF